MVVSFKVSKKGTRFSPKIKHGSSSTRALNHEVDAPPQLQQIQSPTTRKRSVDVIEDVSVILDADVSFIVNIFPDGYSIEKYPSESNVGVENTVQDDSKIKLPYGKSSEKLFNAIECGQLPLDFLDDDITCKYIKGAVACEVRDYRKGSCKPDNGPCITRVFLKMSVYDMLKDILPISNTSYNDSLKVESRILLTLNTKLSLYPVPDLDRLSKDPTVIKLNLDIPGIRRKRLKQMYGATTIPENSNLRAGVSGQPEFVDSTNQSVGQSNVIDIIPKDHAPENLNSRVEDSSPIMGQPVFVDLTNENVGQSNMIATSPENHAPEKSTLEPITGQSEFVNLANWNVGHSNMIATNHAPENPRLIMGQRDFVDLTNENVGQTNMIATNPERHAPNTAIPAFQLLCHQPKREIGYVNPENMQNHAPDDGDLSSVVFGKRGNQMSSMVDLSEKSRSDFMVSDGKKSQIGSLNSSDSCWKKQQSTDMQKQMLTMQQQGISFHIKQEPQSSNFTQSPENNTIHKQTSPQVTTSSMQRAGVIAVHGTQSLTSNESTQTKVTNPIPNTQNKLGFPSNTKTTSSPVPVKEEIDTKMLDRFSIIKTLTSRYLLNNKRTKFNILKRTTSFPKQELFHALSNNHIQKDETCKTPLSNSFIGGNINVCKTRVLKFVKNEHLQSGDFVPKMQSRLILSERPDGTVAMYYGELDDYDYMAEDQLLPTIPNTHTADLIAAEFCSLMSREGYHLEDDNIEPRPVSKFESTGGQPNEVFAIVDIRHNPEAFSFRSRYEDAKPYYGGPTLMDMQIAMAHPQYRGLWPRSLKSEPQSIIYQNSNMQQPQSVNNNVARPQFSVLQQLEQQSAMQRKMMTGNVGGIGWNAGGNNSTVKEIGGGYGYAGQSTNVMGMSIGSSINNAAAIMPMSPRVSQSGPNFSGGPQGQFGNFGGLQVANRKFHPGSGSGSGSGSMMGYGINNMANNMNHMQRNVMGPSSLMPSMNPNPNHILKQYIKQEPRSLLQTVLMPPQQVAPQSPLIGMPHQQQQGSYQPNQVGSQNMGPGGNISDLWM